MLRRNSLLIFMALLFFGLLAGAALTDGGNPLPTVEQVSSPEASVLQGTDNQYATFALLVLLVLGSLGAMGTGLAVLFWFLNRGVKRTEVEEAQPFDFSLTATEGNTAGALIQNNAFAIVVTIAILLIVLVVTLTILSGALA
ncbi:MAG: hypothetical protein L0154_30665 [Chloroflexi bacterium]|nr:hypothetical protein [Chloroflexota bacterium]